MNLLNIFPLAGGRQGENSMKLRNAVQNAKSCCHLRRSFDLRTCFDDGWAKFFNKRSCQKQAKVFSQASGKTTQMWPV